MSSVGDFEALSRLLTPLLRLLRRSSRLAAELAQRGLAARVMELLKKPNAHTCLSLLDILRVLYENHPNPKVGGPWGLPLAWLAWRWRLGYASLPYCCGSLASCRGCNWICGACFVCLRHCRPFFF